jgi:hypothetical protein
VPFETFTVPKVPFETSSGARQRALVARGHIETLSDRIRTLTTPNRKHTRGKDTG